MLRRLLGRTYFFYSSRVRRPAFGKRFKELCSDQWLEPEVIAHKRWNKLSNLLGCAYQNVPYYQELFNQEGINPSDIRTLSDFRRIPILTKEIIQANKTRLLARELKADSYYENHTGGSTGVPLAFYQSNEYDLYNVAAIEFTFRMCGYKRGDRSLFVWGADFDLPRGNLKDRLRNYLSNTKFINAFNLTEEKLHHYMIEMNMWQPEYIWGYVSSLEMLARFLKEEQIKNIQPKAIQATAEVLTPIQREIIEHAFGCKVFNRYGCREVGIIAHECTEHHGLHILDTNQYVEIVDDTDEPVANGEVGRLIVTNLNNYAMPFIRYEVGDIGRFLSEPCKCGRGFSLLKDVIGRKSDIIISPSGKIIHGEFFTHLFYKIKGVKKFQVIQETLNEIHIKIVHGENFKDENFNFLSGAIQNVDSEFIISYELCDDIPASKSGKYRFIMSKVSKEWMQNA